MIVHRGSSEDFKIDDSTGEIPTIFPTALTIIENKTKGFQIGFVDQALLGKAFFGTGRHLSFFHQVVDIFMELGKSPKALPWSVRISEAAGASKYFRRLSGPGAGWGADVLTHKWFYFNIQI